jgi:hypothetical protein
MSWLDICLSCTLKKRTTAGELSRQPLAVQCAVPNAGSCCTVKGVTLTKAW